MTTIGNLRPCKRSSCRGGYFLLEAAMVTVLIAGISFAAFVSLKASAESIRRTGMGTAVKSWLDNQEEAVRAATMNPDPLRGEVGALTLPSLAQIAFPATPSTSYTGPLTTTGTLQQTFNVQIPGSRAPIPITVVTAWTRNTGSPPFQAIMTYYIAAFMPLDSEDVPLSEMGETSATVTRTL